MTRDDNLQDLTSRLKTGRLTRRDFVLRALALGVSVSAIGTVLSACGGGDDDGGGGGEQVTMSFVSWGGTFQEAQTKAWLDPYAAANPNVTWCVWTSFPRARSTPTDSTVTTSTARGARVERTFRSL